MVTFQIVQCHPGLTYIFNFWHSLLKLIEYIVLDGKQWIMCLFCSTSVVDNVIFDLIFEVVYYST